LAISLSGAREVLALWRHFARTASLFPNINLSISVASASDQPAPITNRSLGALHDHLHNEADGHSQRDFDAAIFDMDGVVTDTAAIHSLAWKRMFDEYLQGRAASRHEPFIEFTHARDYLVHVDGRPRYTGVETFLKSRDIILPAGSPQDLPGSQTVCGLGNRKNEIFHQIIGGEGVALFDSTIALIHAMRQRGIKVGLATSSNNSAVILDRTGTAQLFATVVDGIVSARLGLKGKPEPDIFLTAAANLGVPAARAIVVEDAVSGVQAGARGGFALVIGIARENNARELCDHGADVAVRDLAEISLPQIDRLVQNKRASV
jgi:beta-phosphoglucomutase family hydrolase